VTAKLGIGSAETLRKWVRQAEVDAETRPGINSEESAEIQAAEAENAELRRASEISRRRRLSSQSSTAHRRKMGLARVNGV
jgi:transposase